MIAQYAEAFGLGRPPGIDLGGEKPGLVPYLGPAPGASAPGAGMPATP